MIFLKYDGFSRFSDEGLAVYSKDGLYGIINSNGEKILNPTYTRIDPFSQEFAVVEVDSKCGYLNKEGEIVLPVIWEAALSFVNGLALVMQQNYKFGCINLRGELVIPAIYSELGQYAEDRLFFKKGKKYGFLNGKGEVILPALYDETDQFSNGLAPVKLKNKWGIINLNGDFVIEPKFDMATRFVNGYSRIVFDNKLGLLKEDGEIKSYPQCRYVDYPYKGIISAILE